MHCHRKPVTENQVAASRRFDCFSSVKAKVLAKPAAHDLYANRGGARQAGWNGDRGKAKGCDGKPTGEGGKALAHAFPRFAEDLAWWVEAAKTQRAKQAPPY